LAEVDGFEVGMHVENEIFDLRDLAGGDGFREFVVPVVLSLGAVGEGDDGGLAGGDGGGGAGVACAGGDRGGVAVDQDGEVVVDGLGGRKSRVKFTFCAWSLGLR